MTSQKVGQAVLFVRKALNPAWSGKKSKSGEDLGSVPRYAALHHRLPIGREFFNRRAIRSGDPKWLFTTSKVFRERFKTQVRGHIRQFIAEGESRSDIQRWYPRFNQRMKRLSVRIQKQPGKTAVEAREFARKIAPRDDGYLYQAIDYTIVK